MYNLNLKGKNFRSAIIFMLARSIYNSRMNDEPLKPFEDTLYYNQVKALSACIEIAHNASLLQDDIIDRADQRRSQKAAHKIYGASNSVFSSDFMISRASRMLTEVFHTTHISQIFSTILYNLVFVRKKFTQYDSVIGRVDPSEERYAEKRIQWYKWSC